MKRCISADILNSHAVRALRIKRSSVESYQKAGVQFWHEQSTNTINLRSGATVALNTASTVRSNATVKVHSTRIVMYMYREKNVVLLFGMFIALPSVPAPTKLIALLCLLGCSDRFY